MAPFFSVVIPTLNEEHYLPKLLDQLSRQSDKDFEVIIVDGQSKDRTKEAALENRGLSLKFFVNAGSNVSSQRNFGAGKSSGQYLIFLDADTGIYFSFIKKVRRAINKKKGLVFIPYVNPKEKNIFPEMKLIYPLINLIVEASQNFSKAISAGGNMIWEKNFFCRVGGFDEKLAVTEDHDIIRKAHLWGVRVRFLHTVRISFSLRRMKREGRLRLFYKILVSHLHLVFNDKLKKKLFDYEMGGHLYHEENKIQKNNNPIDVAKKLFRKLVREI